MPVPSLGLVYAKYIDLHGESEQRDGTHPCRGACDTCFTEWSCAGATHVCHFAVEKVAPRMLCPYEVRAVDMKRFTRHKKDFTVPTTRPPSGPHTLVDQTLRQAGSMHCQDHTRNSHRIHFHKVASSPHLHHYKAHPYTLPYSSITPKLNQSCLERAFVQQLRRWPGLVCHCLDSHRGFSVEQGLQSRRIEVIMSKPYQSSLGQGLCCRESQGQDGLLHQSSRVHTVRCDALRDLWRCTSSFQAH